MSIPNSALTPDCPPQSQVQPLSAPAPVPAAALGRLERVELRTGWSHEAHNFTPWLAEQENLDLLGGTLGLQLELQSREHAVGRYSADLLCRDVETEEHVLIENQLECTNHSHLGQILTYAAGLKATTVVWIAATFNEEHRAALDWLNEITDERFRFFGVEIELWRIATSPLAPKFNIVAKPNNWARALAERARESAGVTETGKLRLDYWTDFTDLLRTRGFATIPTPRPEGDLKFSIGRSGFRIETIVTTWDAERGYEGGEARVQLIITSPTPLEDYECLRIHQSAIATALHPDKVAWHNSEGTKRRRVDVSRPCILSDRSTWPADHAWLADRLQTFDRVFRPLVSDLARGPRDVMQQPADSFSLSTELDSGIRGRYT